MKIKNKETRSKLAEIEKSMNKKILKLKIINFTLMIVMIKKKDKKNKLCEVMQNTIKK